MLIHLVIPFIFKNITEYKNIFEEDKAINRNKAAIFLSLYTSFLSVLEIFYQDKYEVRK